MAYKHCARHIAVLSCFLTSLACGTIYVYSAYSTHLADRLGLTATQSSMIGMMGTMGVSLLGAVAGSVTDKFGPTVPIAFGSVCLLAGYGIIYYSYVHNVRILSLLAFGSCLAGFGSTLAYSASMKTAVLNFPKARGTAVALPIAAFGLSAFFFSSLKAVLFSSTQEFLGMLAVVTSGMLLINTPFVKVHALPVEDEPEGKLIENEETSSYGAIDDESSSGPILTRSSRQFSESTLFMPTGSPLNHSRQGSFLISGASTRISTPQGSANVSNSIASLLRKDSVQSLATIVPENVHVKVAEHSVSTWKMFKTTEFWAQFTVLGLLSGSSQMYIYCCGYVVHALILKKPAADLASVQNIQALQVAVISLFSFVGRMLSGTFSDVLTKRLGFQRMWMVCMASAVGLIGHLSALLVSNANHLWITSCLIGLSYGLTFGVFATIVCDTFGVQHFSKNWGFVGMSPVFTVYVFNLIFGSIYDRHSFTETVVPVGQLTTQASVCLKGIECYAEAFQITSWVSFVTLLAVLWMIYTEKHQAPRHPKIHLFIETDSGC